MNGGEKSPKEEWARIYVDNGHDSLEAVNLLRERGYFVHTLRVAGNFVPRLLFRHQTFEGLSEIRRFLSRDR
jgi:hypothetical protein